MPLGFAVAGVIRSDRVPANPLALFRLAVPRDEKRQEGLAFIDSLADVDLDLTRTLPSANLQRDGAPGFRQADQRVIIVDGLQRADLVPFDETLDDVALGKLIPKR